MRVLLLLLSLYAITAYAQIPSLEPKWIGPIPNINLEKCERLVYEAEGERNYWKMSKREKKLIDLAETNLALSHFYGVGCSWYCGGVVDTVTASSALNNEYLATNVHDFRITTTWIDGSRGNGEGEFIVYSFPGDCPRITNISIHNGYVKNKKLWKKYGRVKKLLMYYNNEPYAILNLKDCRDYQNFEVGTLGFKHKQNASAWTLKFEIIEVYPGKKSRHTAITEIYFDGIDVH